MDVNGYFQYFIRQVKKTDIFETMRHAKNYFGADIATKALGFISIPVLTRLLTTEDYGIINVFYAYVSIFIVILTLNSYTAVSRYYYENTDDLKEFVGTTLYLSCMCLAVSTTIFICFLDEIAVYTNLTKYLLIFTLVAVILGIFESIFSQILACQKKSRPIAIVAMLQSYIGFAVSIMFIYAMPDNKYLGSIYGKLSVSFLAAIYQITIIRQYTKLIFNWKHVIYIAKYSVPLIPYYLGGIILAQFSRIMIGNINGIGDAGLYSFAYNVGMLQLVFTGAVQAALIPDFFRFMDKQEYERLYSLDRKTFSIILVFALGLVYYSQEMVWILAAPKFHEALPVVPIVVIGYVFYALFMVYIKYTGYIKKTWWSSLVVIVSGIISIILNYLYLPVYGYIAGAYTTLVSYAVMFLLSWVIAKYVSKLPVTPVMPFLKQLAIFFIFIIVYICSSFLLNLNYIVLFFIKLILLVLFLSIIFKDEFKKMKQ